jgi:hypothetical protein
MRHHIWLDGVGIYKSLLTDTETPMKTKNPRKLDRSTVGIRLGACAAAMGGTAAFAPEAQAQITTFNTPIPVPQTTAGVYINLATGATGTSQAGTPGWDFNPYNANAGTQLGFYWAPAPAGGVAATTTGPYLGLHSGDVVGPGSTYTRAILGTTGSPFVTTGTNILGFAFTNEVSGLTNYGYATIQTTGTSGFPATILNWSFDASGAPITVAGVPEPTSLLLTAAAMVVGSRGLRRWRRNTAA